MTESYAKAFEKARKAAEKLGHTHTTEADGMIDTVFCSCGWDSGPHFDGMEWALEKWWSHVKPIIEEGQASFDLQQHQS